MTTLTTAVSLARHGIDARRHDPSQSHDLTALCARAGARGRARSQRAARSSSTPARFTGRSPKDKFVVARTWIRRRGSGGARSTSRSSEDRFDGLRAQGRPTTSMRRRRSTSSTPSPAPTRSTGSGCASSRRARTTRSSRRRCSSGPTDEELEEHDADRRSCSTRPRSRPIPRRTRRGRGTFVVLHPSRTEVVIGGTFYAGEIKKSIFTVMNDRLPLEGVLPMHCSANVGEDGRRRDLLRALRHRQDDAVRRSRRAHLIGDDEHGWGANGVFNIEGGCYAKVIRLNPPRPSREIFRTTHTFGTILENVTMDERGDPRSRRRLEDREHARRVRARADPEHRPGQACRASEHGHLSHRRRLRDPAADRAAHARAGAVLLPLRVHRQAGRNRDRGRPSRSRPSRRASARPSSLSAPSSTRACSARSSTPTARPCGS